MSLSKANKNPAASSSKPSLTVTRYLSHLCQRYFKEPKTIENKVWNKTNSIFSGMPNKEAQENKQFYAMDSLRISPF